SDIVIPKTVLKLEVLGVSVSRYTSSVWCIERTFLPWWQSIRGASIKLISGNGFTSEPLARNLGNVMGSFLDYDASSRMNVFSNFMRICVRLDIHQPIIGHSDSSSQKLLDSPEGELVKGWPEEIRAEMISYEMKNRQKKATLWMQKKRLRPGSNSSTQSANGLGNPRAVPTLTELVQSNKS
ncbi:hypothetical protein Goarm_002969, partial [Gossypium armourianum]|nr:hypothetical protein [Gossypium armourianum]